MSRREKSNPIESRDEDKSTPLSNFEDGDEDGRKWRVGGRVSKTRL